MGYSSADLRSFLDEVESRHKLLRITKATDVRSQIPALCSETRIPTLFENLPGFDGFRLSDCLLRDRLHQSIALGCQPEEVITHFAKLCARGPGETVLVKDSPVKHTIWTGIGYSRYPINAITGKKRKSFIKLTLVQQQGFSIEKLFYFVLKLQVLVTHNSFTPSFINLSQAANCARTGNSLAPAEIRLLLSSTLSERTPRSVFTHSLPLCVRPA
jgi:hypothetical protein